MHELDEVWNEMIAKAEFDARNSVHSEMTDYIALKTANDKIRTTAVEWLFGILSEAVELANKHRRANIGVERQNPHSFSHRNANLTGSLIRFTQGVRCLTVEAGWTRTPGDGFVRGGGLAHARLTHFGFSKENAELVLLKTENLPEWFVAAADDENTLHLFDLNQLVRHFQTFLDVR